MSSLGKYSLYKKRAGAAADLWEKLTNYLESVPNTGSELLRAEYGLTDEDVSVLKDAAERLMDTEDFLVKSARKYLKAHLKEVSK